MADQSQYELVTETVAWLRQHLGDDQPVEVAFILGSGLGSLADHFDGAKGISYDKIPNFPTSTVVGHEGRLVFGTFGGKRAVAMQGRFHFYEGWSLDQVTFPVRVFSQLGCKVLVVTNSSGGINVDWQAGDLMLIRDHINFTGVNPLRGANEPEFGARFPDMSDAYDLTFRRQIMKLAREIGINLRTGIYAGVQGPSYETPAEVNMLRRLGGDAVGMSTVPEVIVANHCGLRVIGLSCITNMAAGVSDHRLTHEEVTETAARVRERFAKLLTEIVSRLDMEEAQSLS